jgi:hypothetical protein
MLLNFDLMMPSYGSDNINSFSLLWNYADFLYSVFWPKFYNQRQWFLNKSGFKLIEKRIILNEVHFKNIAVSSMFLHKIHTIANIFCH